MVRLKIYSAELKEKYTIEKTNTMRRSNYLMYGYRFKKRKRKRFDFEYREQRSFILHMRVVHRDILFTASTQGMKLPIGIAKKLKVMGYNVGTPDVMIFEPRGKYHGLFIEMKRSITFENSKKGKLSESQKIFLDMLDKRGYKTAVCYGHQEAIDTLENYLKNEGE